MVHMGTNDIAKKDLGNVVRDYEVLGKKLNTFGAQVAFLSFQMIKGREARE